MFLFLDFHIAHSVIEIRIRSLSESLLRSSLKVITADPLIRPKDMAGQFQSVVFLHMFVVVSGPGLSLPVVLTS